DHEDDRAGHDQSDQDEDADFDLALESHPAPALASMTPREKRHPCWSNVATSSPGGAIPWMKFLMRGSSLVLNLSGWPCIRIFPRWTIARRSLTSNAVPISWVTTMDVTSSAPAMPLVWLLMRALLIGSR